MKTVADFILGGSKITADGDCTYEIKRCLLLGKKVMANLDSILKKQTHYFPNKDPSSQGYGFVWIVIYGCENWTIKKAECRKIDAFELWCWRRLLRVPWTWRSNQSILKEINSEYSLEGPLLKLKQQYFGHLIRGADSLEKTLMLGKINGKRRREQRSISWLEVSPTQWT